MPNPLDPNPIRIRFTCGFRRALAAGLLAAAAWVGCRETDPLETIRQQQASGDLAGTVEPLRELLAEQPDNAEASYLYGRALAATQQGSLATWALRNAMKDPVWTVSAGIQLAYAAIGNADYNEAVEAAGIVLEREPDNVTALLARANANAQWRKDPQQALADADRVLQINPDAIEAYESRILALLSLERIEEAATTLAELGRRIDEVDPPEGARAWYCATSAIFAEESNELDEARETWQRCRKDYPAAPEMVWGALRFYDDHKEPLESQAVLRAAIEGEPDSLAYRTALAERLRLMGDVGGGEALLREATQVDNAQLAASAWLELGRYRRNVGEPGAAVEAMERALQLGLDLGPVPPQIPFEYAEALMLAEQYDRALEVADDLPVPAHRHLIRARIAQEQGNPKRALEEYDEALRLWPNNPWARYYAARAAEEIGDFDRALEEYRTSIRIDPGATDARTRAARLLLAEGKPRFASQLLRELQHEKLELSGALEALRLAGRFGTPEDVDATFARTVVAHPALSPATAVAEAAAGIAESPAGPAGALKMLRDAKGIRFDETQNADALRALVRFSHQADAQAVTPPELRAALAAHPDAAAFQEIRGLDLELAGGDVAAARAAYSRALESEPDDARALAGLGRLSLSSDPQKALEYFDRAAAADPDDAESELQAARALVALGKRDEAAERLDALLEAHPLEGDAASLSASLDLERGVATPRTVERARRAARFGGGVAALELLERVYEQRDEPDQAKQVAERARVLREKEAKGKAVGPEDADDEMDGKPAAGG